MQHLASRIAAAALAAAASGIPCWALRRQAWVAQTGGFDHVRRDVDADRTRLAHVGQEIPGSTAKVQHAPAALGDDALLVELPQRVRHHAFQQRSQARGMSRGSSERHERCGPAQEEGSRRCSTPSHAPMPSHRR